MQPVEDPRHSSGGGSFRRRRRVSGAHQNPDQSQGGRIAAYFRTAGGSTNDAGGVGGGGGGGGGDIRWGYFDSADAADHQPVDDHRKAGGEVEGDVGDDGIVRLLVDACALVSLSLLALCLVGLLTILLLLYVSVRPFSPPLYRRLSCSLAAGPFLDAAALLLPNARLCLTGDSDVPAPVGASVLVCNHLMEGDWWHLLMLGRCVGLRGTMKVFLRSEVLRGQRGTATTTASSDRSSPADGAKCDDGASPNGPDQQLLRTAASAPTLRRTSGGGGGAIMSAGAGAAPTFSSGGNLNGNGSGASGSTGFDGGRGHASGSEDAGCAPPHIRICGYLLRTLLEYPLLSSENDQSWVARDRAETFALLRSFASPAPAADDEGVGGGVDSSSPVQFLLFPEGWSLEAGCGADGGAPVDRRSVLAKSAEFARREGRPQLRHLLLPRTTGFSACLESLRESSPVVYDVTMAYRGYDGSTPHSSSPRSSLPSTVWSLARGHSPREIHFRIKRHSMEEVLSDGPRWLDSRWAEKDRALGHFARHGTFPVDPRGYFCRHRAFDTRTHGIEGSLAGLVRLGLTPFLIPLLLFLSVPLCLLVLWLWLAHRAFLLVFPDWAPLGEDWYGASNAGGDGSISAGGGARRTPGSTGGSSLGGLTPFFPATPFASPTHVPGNNWRPSQSEPLLSRKEGGGGEMTASTTGAGTTRR